MHIFLHNVPDTDRLSDVSGPTRRSARKSQGNLSNSSIRRSARKSLVSNFNISRSRGGSPTISTDSGIEAEKTNHSKRKADEEADIEYTPSKRRRFENTRTADSSSGKNSLHKRDVRTPTSKSRSSKHLSKSVPAKSSHSTPTGRVAARKAKGLTPCCLLKKLPGSPETWRVAGVGNSPAIRTSERRKSVLQKVEEEGEGGKKKITRRARYGML